MATDRATAPQDVANMVFFLGSDEAANVTGHVFPVDGGIMISSPIAADFRYWQSNA
jgi:NAD(P)-dependent dehydrogenase (short-subunit alcohol dehydrogenase family)